MLLLRSRYRNSTSHTAQERGAGERPPSLPPCSRATAGRSPGNLQLGTSQEQGQQESVMPTRSTARTEGLGVVWFSRRKAGNLRSRRELFQSGWGSG